MSKYELLKDINSPIGSCKAGTIGKDDGHGRIWFESQYWDKATCDAQPTWFKKLPERIEVTVDTFPFGYMSKENAPAYSFTSTYEISKEKFPLIKQAIEDVLNEVPLWEMEDVKIIMEDAFNAGRKIEKIRFEFPDIQSITHSYPTFQDYLKSL